MLDRQGVIVPAFRVISEVLGRIVDLPLLFVPSAVDSCCAPGMTVEADLGTHKKIIQDSEFTRQLVMIRSKGFAKVQACLVGLRSFQISKDLVIGPVFLNDVDHMSDWIKVDGLLNCS